MLKFEDKEHLIFNYPKRAKLIAMKKNIFNVNHIENLDQIKK